MWDSTGGAAVSGSRARTASAIPRCSDQLALVAGQSSTFRIARASRAGWRHGALEDEDGELVPRCSDKPHVKGRVELVEPVLAEIVPLHLDEGRVELRE